MTTYPIRSLRGEIAGAVVLVAFTSAIFAITILPVLTGSAPRGEWFGRIVVGGLFLLGCLVGGLSSLRSIREIRVSDDGTVEFTRRWATRRMPASDIRSMAGHYHRDYDGNMTIWRLTVVTAHGTFKFEQFTDVLHFADQIRSLNPGVAIEGLWPMVAPRRTY
jgi:hypothetical protein